MSLDAEDGQCNDHLVAIDGEIDTHCEREPEHDGRHSDGMVDWDDDYAMTWRRQ